MTIIQSNYSIPLPLAGSPKLGIHRFHKVNNDGPGVLALHGMIENGKIFYSSSGRGLAPYLAERGFNVFVADFRGRGTSEPPIRKSNRFNQTNTIKEDIPTLINHVFRECGGRPIHVVCHSWGGVLLMASYARSRDVRDKTKSSVFFGTKRTVRSWSFDRLVGLELGWNRSFRILAKIYGYLPARKFGFGADDETRAAYLQCVEWVKKDRWIDSDDGFDYHAAFKKIQPLPILSLTGQADTYLGNPLDCSNFLKEVRAPVLQNFFCIGTRNGNKHNYDHVSILTHRDAPFDHFPKVADWLTKISGRIGTF